MKEMMIDKGLYFMKVLEDQICIEEQSPNTMEHHRIIVTDSSRHLDGRTPIGEDE